MLPNKAIKKVYILFIAALLCFCCLAEEQQIIIEAGWPSGGVFPNVPQLEEGTAVSTTTGQMVEIDIDSVSGRIAEDYMVKLLSEGYDFYCDPDCYSVFSKDGVDVIVSYWEDKAKVIIQGEGLVEWGTDNYLVPDFGKLVNVAEGEKYTVLTIRNASPEYMPAYFAKLKNHGWTADGETINPDGTAAGYFIKGRKRMYVDYYTTSYNFLIRMWEER